MVNSSIILGALECLVCLGLIVFAIVSFSYGSHLMCEYKKGQPIDGKSIVVIYVWSIVSFTSAFAINMYMIH